MSIETAARELAEAMQPKSGPAPYDTQATVLRVEGDTLWVHIPGGADETPVQRTINASPGDTIQIRVGGGTAWAVGNATAPPTDDAKANAAHSAAETADGKAVRADEKAEEALEQLKVHRAEIEQLFADWAQIGTAIINTLQATGVNADWINTGTLNAARIGAGTISADKLSVGQGGNLYPAYDSFEQVTNDTLSYLSASGATPAVVKTAYAYHGAKVLRIVTDSGVTNGYVHLGHSSNGYGQIRLTTGRYVASGYVRCTSSGSSASVRINVFGRDSRGATWNTGEYTLLGNATKTIGTTWTRIEVPFTLSSNQFVSLSVALQTASETIYCDCFQIEEVASGQGAGTWHPAGTTQIDGGTIVAQSIKAAALDVESLFAEDIVATGSFQVDNGAWKLQQDTTGLNLMTAAKSEGGWNPRVNLMVSEGGCSFIYTEPSNLAAGFMASGTDQSDLRAALYCHTNGVTVTKSEAWVGAPDVYLNGDTITSYGNIVPSETNNVTLGTPTKQWDGIYANYIGLNGSSLKGLIDALDGKITHKNGVSLKSLQAGIYYVDNATDTPPYTAWTSWICIVSSSATGNTMKIVAKPVSTDTGTWEIHKTGGTWDDWLETGRTYPLTGSFSTATSVRKPGNPSYGSVLITGTVGGIGAVMIAVTINNGAIGSIRNVMTGAAWSNTNLTITYGVSNNVGYLTFKTTSSANSNLCIIGG